jgi:ATP-dependent DNA helicase RecG
VDKVILRAELFQLAAPEFIAGDDYTRAVLFAPRKLAEMDRSDKVRACYQHASLLRVSNQHMTNATLRRRLAIEA